MHETLHTILFDIYCRVEVVRIENNSHIAKITYLVTIYEFLSFFGTFTHKAAQTLFILHETWHTTLISIYYFVEVVRIENHSHIQEITC